MHPNDRSFFRSLAVSAMGWFMVLFAMACSTNDTQQSPDARDTVDSAMDSTEPTDGSRELLTDSTTDTFQMPDFCEGKTVMIYDPLHSKELELWPDDRLTKTDESSPTGIRLNVNKKNAKWLPWAPNFIKPDLDKYQYLSGFGINGEVLMRFSGPISQPPGTIQESLDSKSLIFVDLDAEPPEAVPYTAHTGDDNKDLFIQPVYPLKPGHHYAVVMTRDYPDADKGCIAPSPALKSMLTQHAGDDDMNRAGRDMLEALKKLQIPVENVSAMTVFVTENDIAVIRKAAQNAKAKDHDWVMRKECEKRTSYKRCEVVFESDDYRNADGFIQTPEPKSTWNVPATVWLPVKDKGPYPVIVFGHGIGGDRYMVNGLADWICNHGFAIIAAPAMKHGGHPTASGVDQSQWALNFLGFDLKTVTFYPMQLRGNMNQTEMDRLEMIATLKKHPDIDGDGNPDLDPTHMVYWGISLGSLMAPEIMAMEDNIRAGVLTVGGGNLMLFATTGEKVEQMKPFIIKLAGSEERFNRLVVPVQNLVDAGDPNTFAPHVLTDRFSGTKTIPSILFPVADQDDTVPPACAHALAQALRIPQMKPVCTPVPGIDVIDPPVHGNLANGKATAAYFQFDRVWWDKNKDPEPAKHNNTPGSAEAMLQLLHFLDTWLADGVGEIINPYPQIGTPPLPAS